MSTCICPTSWPINQRCPVHGKGDSDPVNHPPHYTQNGIECIDAIKASMSPDAFLGFLKGNAMKYLWRYQHKGNPAQDMQKAMWYLNRMVEELSK